MIFKNAPGSSHYTSQSYNVETLDRTVGDRRHVVTVELAVMPVDMTAASACDLAFTEETEKQLSPEIKEAVENGVRSSYLQGIAIQSDDKCDSFECVIEELRWM